MIVCINFESIISLPLTYFSYITLLQEGKPKLIYLQQMQLQPQPPSLNKHQPQNQPLSPHSLTYLQQFLSQQNSKLKLSQQFLFLKVVMGKYFIQAYRVFKMLPQMNAMILWKRQDNKTHYKFFLVFESMEEMGQKVKDLRGKEEGGKVELMKRSVEKMTRKELVDYSISIAFVEQLKKINFPTLTAYHTFLTSLQQNPDSILQRLTSVQPTTTSFPFTVQSFTPSLKKQDQQLLFQSNKQFDTLKELMSVYMDTFGNEQKGRKIYKEIDKSSGSFSVDLLLNTLNYIIFEEVHNSCYSQIEPCYWTCFQSSTKQLNSDRKHIALTGSGEICVLQIIFLKDFESENKTEYSMMLTEFKKFYKKAKIKVYRILNEKWNGQVEKIDLEDGPDKKSQVPAIIYKLDIPKTAWEYTASAAK